MDSGFLKVLVVGLGLGFKHALDADHLVTLSVLVNVHSRASRAVTVGLLWGIGHTLTLFVLGLCAIVFHIAMPPVLNVSFELAVGIVMVILGVQALWKYKRRKIHHHEHYHDGTRHRHFHAHLMSSKHAHDHSPKSYKSFLIGMAHGLAGSAPLLLFVLVTIRTELQGIVYVAVFSFGSMLGMFTASGLMAAVLWATTRRFKRFSQRLQLLIGTAAVAVGCLIVGKIGLAMAL